MATCKDCLHVDVCQKARIINPAYDYAPKCNDFKDRSRFVELPLPISEGAKLYYIFEEIDDTMEVGKSRATVTRVCKDGFYVSSRVQSDGTYYYGDDFYPWDAIGTEVFFTREEAERILKECEGK